MAYGIKASAQQSGLPKDLTSDAAFYEIEILDILGPGHYAIAVIELCEITESECNVK